MGSTVAVGHETGLTVEAKSFSDVYYPDGSPKDYASELVLYKNGVEVERQTVRVNHPMKFGGVAFDQSFFGGAAASEVQGAGGKAVFGDGGPVVWAMSKCVVPSLNAGRPVARWRSNGALSPKFCQRPSEIAGSFSPLRPQRRYCIVEYRLSLNLSSLLDLARPPGSR